MKNLPSNLFIEKNKTDTNSAWVILLVVTLNDGTIFRLCNNNESVDYDGNTYIPCPFELDVMKSGLKGEVPQVTLRIGNAARDDAQRFMASYMESTSGFIDTVIDIIILNTENKTESYTELTWTYDVIQSSINNYWIEFTLGAPNPLRKKFPNYYFYALACNWMYKEDECAYTAIPAWQATTKYTLNYRITPIASNGRKYKCTNSGVSGSSEPTWTLNANGIVSDGAVTWQEDGVMTMTYCYKSLTDCEAHSNTSRFGGFVGLGIGGMRFA